MNFPRELGDMPLTSRCIRSPEAALRAAPRPGERGRYAAFALGIRVSLEKGVRPRPQTRSCAS
jgi:hypothetical protein